LTHGELGLFGSFLTIGALHGFGLGLTHFELGSLGSSLTMGGLHSGGIILGPIGSIGVGSGSLGGTQG
jgi:hypothetical protein